MTRKPRESRGLPKTRLILTVDDDGRVDVVMAINDTFQRFMIAPWRDVLAAINPTCPVFVRREQ